MEGARARVVDWMRKDTVSRRTKQMLLLLLLLLLLWIDSGVHHQRKQKKGRGKHGCACARLIMCKEMKNGVVSRDTKLYDVKLPNRPVHFSSVSIIRLLRNPHVRVKQSCSARFYALSTRILRAFLVASRD